MGSRVGTSRGFVGPRRRLGRLALGLWGRLCNFPLIATAGLIGLALQWFADRTPQVLRQSRLSLAETHGDE